MNQSRRALLASLLTLPVAQRFTRPLRAGPPHWEDVPEALRHFTPDGKLISCIATAEPGYSFARREFREAVDALNRGDHVLVLPEGMNVTYSVVLG